MNPHLPWILLSLLLWGTGCTSIPTDQPDFEMDYDSQEPQISFPGGRLDEVRGLAMGLAVTRGWTILSSQGNQLMLQRDLAPDAAHILFPKTPIGDRAPRLQVRTRFLPQQGGLVALVDAQVIIGQGTKRERREEFTEEFRPELMASLTELYRTWEQNRQRIAAGIPPLPQSQPEAVVSTSPEETAAQPQPTSSEIAGSPETAQAPDPREASPWSLSPTRGSPVEERSLNATGDFTIAQPPVSSGIWAYSAEAYARDQGCGLTDLGAVLTQEEPFSTEIYEVACLDGHRLRVRCQAGDCQSMPE